MEVINNRLTWNFRFNKPLSIRLSNDPNYSNNDMIIDSSKHSVSVEAIFLWRYYGYSNNSIAAVLSIKNDRTDKILAQYRKNVKIACDKNRRKTKGIRISIEANRLEAIKEYLKQPVVWSIMIKNTKNCVWLSNRPERAPHDSIISRILRKEWNMIYKIIQKYYPLTEKANNICLFHEAFVI